MNAPLATIICTHINLIYSIKSYVITLGVAIAGAASQVWLYFH